MYKPSVIDGFFVSCAYIIYKMNKRKTTAKWILFALTIIINAFIIYHSFMNGNQSSNESSKIALLIKNVINTFSPNAINESNFETFHGVIRKLVGHFGLFLIDGLFVYWTIHFFFKDKWWVKIIISLGIGLFVASLTEMIQLFIPNRAGSFIDILIDYSGFIVGAGISFLVIFIHKKAVLKNNN